MFRFLGVPVAWHNLTYDPWRFGLFSVGIAFAVVLMFVQNGFRNALLDSNLLLIKHLNADLVLVNPQRATLGIREPISRRRLYQAGSVEGVRQVAPLYLEYHLSLFRHAEANSDQRKPTRPIRVIGIDPDSDTLNLPALEQNPSLLGQLKQHDRILFDRRGKPAADGRGTVFGLVGTGTQTDLAGRHVEVAGTFELGSDFAAEGTVIVSANTFAELLRRPYYPGDPLDEIELGLIRVERPAELEKVRAAVRSRLPAEEVEVLTLEELASRETAFWLDFTPIGVVFGFGMLMGLAVGLVICTQILTSDVADHEAEYATLRAIGYTNWYLGGVVLQEGMLLAVAGFLPGLVTSWLVFRVLEWMTGLPLELNAERIGFVLLLTVGMCAVSAIFAVQRAMQVDPAEVF